MSIRHQSARRLLLALSMLAALVPIGSPPAAAVSTGCDGLPDAEVPADAFIPTRFLADVDGDQNRDVVTGYELGGPRPNYEDQDAFLHVELASGWGTVFQLNSLDQYSTFPIAEPSRLVVMAGRRLIVIAVQVGANNRDFAFFEFRNCSLTPVGLTEGGFPDISAGGAVTHEEWFVCRSDAVVMLELERAFPEDGEEQELITGGEATEYRLDEPGFSRIGTVDLNLPRLEDDLRQEFPDCSGFVGSFVDDNGSIFESSIEWLVLEGVTRGCNPPINDRYCPERDVTRGEMAAFMVRAFGLSDDGGGDLFVDDDDSVFEDDIDKLSAAGITKGCNPPANDRYCPEQGVTRGEMAAFLVRALALHDHGGGDLFVDDDDSVFEDDIDKLGAAGITKGCNPPANDRFCPDDHVTRAQMAAFLMRALG